MRDARLSGWFNRRGWRDIIIAAPYLWLSIFFLLPFLALAFISGAQQLPHALAPSELHSIPAYRDSRAGSSRGVTTPPTEPVRTMAEWEEIQSLVICWAQYDGILKQISCTLLIEVPEHASDLCKNDRPVLRQPQGRDLRDRLVQHLHDPLVHLLLFLSFLNSCLARLGLGNGDRR